MPKIADLPEFEGDLVGTELLIVEDDTGTQVARVDVLATRAQFLRSVSTTGNMLDEVKALNKLTGAPDVLPVLDADGAVVGCTFPANVAGAGGGIIGYPLKDSATIARLAGKTILLVGRYVADEGFLAAKGLSDDVIDVGFFAGDYRTGLRHQSQIGTDLLRIAEYQVSGDEAGIGMIARTVPEPATSASALSLRLVSLAYGVLEDSAASLDEMIAAKAAERFGVSLWAEGQPATGEVEAPAVHSHDPVTNYVNGITTPEGANSNGAGVGWYFTPAPEDFALLRGARIRLTCLLDTHGDYDRDLLIVASGDIRADGGGFLTDHRLTSARRYGDGQAHVIEGIFGDGVEQLSIGFNDVSDRVAPRAMGWSIDDIFLEIVATADKRLTGAQATMQLQRNMLARPQRKRKRTEIFIPDDFPDLEQAIAGVVAHQVVNVREGDHDLSDAVKDAFYPTFENIHVRGIGTTKPRLITRLAASTALADVAARSASDFFRSARVENLEIIARNARYGLHLDSSNENRDQHLVFTDVDVTHEGNDDVIAWQAANGGTPSDVWTNCAAVGFGGASGSSCRFDGGRLLGWNFNAFVGHNSPNADAPMLLEIDGYTLDPRAPDRGDSRFAFFFNNLGSGQPDRIRLTGNNLAAPIGMGCWPWFETDPAKIPANKLGNISLTGHGNTPAPYMLIDEGSRALRIRSASEGATSKITVSGAGADILMGPAALRKAVTGAVGLSGSMTGWLDMGDHHVGKDDDVAVTAMRWRLGDRSAAPVPLNVSIDGAAPIAISLNQNFSAMSNEAVCAFINAALGAGAVAELVNTNDLWRPQFADEETRVYNAGTTTIRRKRAVAWADGGRPNGRVMTRADAPTDFAGIAYEDIKPGETGRVKTRGAVCVAIDVDRSDGVEFSAGDIFFVSTNDGKMAVGKGPGVLIATGTMDVLVGISVVADTYALDMFNIQATRSAGEYAVDLPLGIDEVKINETGQITSWRDQATGWYHGMPIAKYEEAAAALAEENVGYFLVEALDPNIKVLSFNGTEITGWQDRTTGKKYGVDAAGDSAAGAAMYAVVSAGRIDILIRQFDDIYVQWQMTHDVVPAVKADVWRISRVREAKRNIDGTFTEVQEICFDGETEVAIQFVGRPSDHIGGKAHGNEMQTRFRLHFDGVEVSPTAYGIFAVERIDMFQASDMFDPGAHATVPAYDGPKIMTCYKHWQWTASDALRLAQHIAFEESCPAFQVGNAYFGIACLGWGSRGYNSVSYGARAPLWAVEDLTVSGFGESYTTADHVMAWGPRYACSTRPIIGWTSPFRTATIDDRPDRRKIYLDFFGGNSGASAGNMEPGETVPPGGSWDVATTINITIKK